MKRRGRGIACMWYPIGFTVAALKLEWDLATARDSEINVKS